MKLLDAKTAGDAVRLVIFIVVTTLSTSLLVILIGNVTFGDSEEYKAVFSDATGVVGGDDVRIAGVRVGSVGSIEIHEKNQAIVTFKVDSDSQLTESTFATIRYRNLVGQRYIALSQGVGGPSVLESGETIPLERTAPALDLTVLFNGFKPLFKALSPEDLNKFAYEIITVFQGEGGTLESLLARTASVTSTLASRDQVIGQLIDNLNQVMVTLGNRDTELSTLLIRLRQFISGLSQDREAILGSLESISTLAVETAGLVGGIREPLVKDLEELRRVAGPLDRNKPELDRALQVLPVKLRKVGRTAIYGSWFNFYLCNFKADVKLPRLPVDLPGQVPSPPDNATVRYNNEAARCDLG
ncbi:MAG TPA: MCE family protein [Nocardioidaceae bacterium]|nr:MCE family protein [Nocardioidaceae bacterium]